MSNAPSETEFKRQLKRSLEKVATMERIEEGIDVDRAQERVEKILSADPALVRRKRSDAGVKREKDHPPHDRQVGKLSTEQVAHIDKLREAWFRAIEASTRAESSMLNAQEAYYRYMDEITAKERP